jgi:branched-chain amino acid transport system ATP-binding protein
MALSLFAKHGHSFRFWQKGVKARLIREKLPEALDRVGLANRADMTAGSLSHGEKRQLEVGMALTGEPELLILDEPMAGMGPGGTVELSRLIRELKGSITMVLVEHDMEVVFSLADRVTVVVYGKHLLTGTVDEVRSHPEVRRAYLGEDG